MKYVVMECHTSYAVLLDEEGRFHAAANRGYEIGQKINNPILMQDEAPVRKKVSLKWLYSAVAIAACLVIVLVPFLQNDSPASVQAFTSVYMTINPEVRIDIDESDIVVSIEGINADGIALLEGYSYEGKNLDIVADELVDRAIEMGYLATGGQITLTFDNATEEWISTTGTNLSTHLDEYLTDKLTVTIQVEKYDTNGERVIIDDGISDYGESDYGESDYGEVVIPTAPDDSASVSDIPAVSEPVTPDEPVTDDSASDYYGYTDYEEQPPVEENDDNDGDSEYDDYDYDDDNDSESDYD